ncbi:transporter substrate-binding domain-containing protein [Marinobacter goseongensis]|uniref:amino acid ABC transporter substrate-binding protein n=1 Tax=Marinobacter goseongensis TaxID=453838 RepID=UPI002003DE70|nr:transporter substrate-binding domain-containing protein [Marinobacter goseongensis]MCK7550758.1 transporter substrate-binding domain-containing protein [Marinobacter goseongensis]
MKTWSRLFALVLLTLAAGQLSAQSEPLKVGITPVPPFVVEAESGEWEGISVDLWREVADGIGRDYTLVPLSFRDLLAQVESGDIDVAVGALTMTAEREVKFDFTHPFFQTGLSIAVPPAPEQGLWASLRALISWQFVSVIIALGALLLGVGFVLWLFERKRNPEQFGGDPIKGIGASFWWAAVTMTTVGYGDKAPVSFAGRAVALAWMFAGLIMVASFTAAITSSLTVSNLQHQIQGPEDLISANVATIAGTASEAYLRDERIRHQLYPDLTAAMLSVANGETDAVVYDRALMQYRNLQLGKKRLTVLPDIFQQQLYGFALPAGSEIRGPVSERVLAVTETASWEDTIRRYLGGK